MYGKDILFHRAPRYSSIQGTLRIIRTAQLFLLLTRFGRHRFILRDPRVWDDPDVFRPERLLRKEGPPFDPLSVVFGFGRR
jgi:hypothetical protein